MATTTMRLGLLLIVALAIIQISKAELENENERQIEQKPEGNLMASSMEEVELRNVREAGNKKREKKLKRRKSKNAKKKKRQNKKKARRKGRKSKPGKGTRKKKQSTRRRKKKGSKKTRNNKSNKNGGKKKKKGGSKKRRFKKKKGTKKFGKKTGGVVSVRQTCDEAKLCQKIKDYIKYSNQLRKVKRIVKSCETMEKKANKSATEFDATVAALDTVIASNAKRRLYIRWRRTQRSTDEVVAIRDNLKNCSVSAKAKCERKVEPACGETALHTECEAALQDWVNKFGPSKGSCLQANADCCACITALAEVDAKCLDFDTKSNNAVKSKKKCTGTDTGSFGFCRKQQQEASVKGPPAACGGPSSGTKAPSSATTAAATAAGATTAKPQGCPIPQWWETCLNPNGTCQGMNKQPGQNGAKFTGFCCETFTIDHNCCVPAEKDCHILNGTASASEIANSEATLVPSSQSNIPCAQCYQICDAGVAAVTQLCGQLPPGQIKDICNAIVSGNFSASECKTQVCQTGTTFGLFSRPCPSQ